MSFPEDSQINFSSFDPEHLIELSYISQSSTDVGILALMNLLEGSVHRNKRSAISGVLFYDNGVYGQILEGYPEVIKPVWNSIYSDPRHKDIRVLGVDKLSKRRFTNWSMKFYGSEEISKFVPELRMSLKDGAPTLPGEILALMRSVADHASHKDSVFPPNSEEA
jgi:hypothetical protein